MDKRFLELRTELKEKLLGAIMVGPIGDIESRVDTVLKDFEVKLIAVIDDEAITRAKTYVDCMHDAEKMGPTVL